MFFSSKGHDVPGLYAALYGLGVLPAERLARLRRLGGLDGHPDVGVPGIEANSGSLGHGHLEGTRDRVGQAARRRDGVVVVMTGDGELQEGQNWEALQAAAHDRLGGLWIVVDRNELQSDKPTEEILALGDLEAKLRAFGWEVETCDGHDHAALAACSRGSVKTTTRPRRSSPTRSRGRASRSWSIRRRSRKTEAPTAGTPVPRRRGVRARSRGARRADRGGLRRARPRAAVVRVAAPTLEGEQWTSKASRRAARARGRPSVTRRVRRRGLRGGARRARRAHENLVVLDADLASDCRVRAFELAYPERFLECGIAEQDMVSDGSGLARHGLLPVVNSFASFLASRANEQIYNQASEQTKVIYALHYAGLIPAGPGKSHQSVRDISLLGALPSMTIVQPANAEETRALLRWAVEEARGKRRDPARDRAVAAPHRARRRARARARTRRCARARTPSCSRTGR